MTRTISQSCRTRSRRRISRRRERHDRRPVGLSSGGASSYAWSAPRDQLRCWEPGRARQSCPPHRRHARRWRCARGLSGESNGWADHLDTDCGWGQAFWQVLLGPSCLWGHVFPRIMVVNSLPSAVIGEAAGERGGCAGSPTKRRPVGKDPTVPKLPGRPRTVGRVRTTYAHPSGTVGRHVTARSADRAGRGNTARSAVDQRTTRETPRRIGFGGRLSARDNSMRAGANYVGVRLPQTQSARPSGDLPPNAGRASHLPGPPSRLPMPDAAADVTFSTAPPLTRSGDTVVALRAAGRLERTIPA